VQKLSGFTQASSSKIRAFAAVVALICVLSACAPSPKPQISPIEDIAAPHFDGSSPKRITVSSQRFTVTGICDAKSEGLQYSFDKTTWKDLLGGCSSTGAFSVSASLTRTITLYVRAKSISGFTAPAEAIITFAPPPTSSSMTLVASSSSSDDRLPYALSVMGHNHTGAPLSNNAITVQTYLPGMIYGSQ
jgi:hypothetical protein